MHVQKKVEQTKYGFVIIIYKIANLTFAKFRKQYEKALLVHNRRQTEVCVLAVFLFSLKSMQLIKLIFELSYPIRNNFVL